MSQDSGFDPQFLLIMRLKTLMSENAKPMQAA